MFGKCAVRQLGFALLLCAAPVRALAATISITPSTCQLDEATSPSDLQFGQMDVAAVTTTRTVQLRCNIQNPGTDFPYYEGLSITYIDSTDAIGSYVSIMVQGVGCLEVSADLQRRS